MFVLDASTVVEILLRSAVGRALWSRLASPWNSLYAPEFLDIEVLHVLRRMAAFDGLPPALARAALSNLLQFPLERFPHAPLLPRMWELRHNLSAYDAAYVALAEGLGAPLLTRDARISRAPGHQAKVEVV